MKVKWISIFVLSLLLIGGLLQVEAIGNLHPIVHSIATSIRRVVVWVWSPYTLKTERATLSLEHDFLNIERFPDDASMAIKKSVSPRKNAKRTIFNQQKPSTMENFLERLVEDSTDELQADSSDSMDSQWSLFLQEMSDSDPVTELFPEAEWYDEGDIGDNNWQELLEAENGEGTISIDEPIRPEFVAPLLDELKTQIQEHLESDLEDAMLEDREVDGMDR